MLERVKPFTISAIITNRGASMAGCNEMAALVALPFCGVGAA